MGETVGDGEITSKNKALKTIVTYVITLYDKPNAAPPTAAQVEAVLLQFKQDADAVNLMVEIEKRSGSLL